jgi:hypothetical protein
MISAVLVCVTFLFGQSQDTIDDLFVFREYPRVRHLNADQKANAVIKLEALRQTTVGKRLQKLSFLLAMLDSHYKINRDYLVGILHGCSTRQPECDDDTAGYVIGLYHGGHRDVLTPLLRAGSHSDGALSELLGPFYGEVLVTEPSEFIVALHQLTTQAQGAVCTLAGAMAAGWNQAGSSRRKRDCGGLGIEQRGSAYAISKWAISRQRRTTKNSGRVAFLGERRSLVHKRHISGATARAFGYAGLQSWLKLQGFRN